MKPLRLSNKLYSTIVRIKGYIEFKTGKTQSIPQVIEYLTTLIKRRVETTPDKNLNTKSELFTVLGPEDCLTLGEALQKNNAGETYRDKIKSDET